MDDERTHPLRDWLDRQDMSVTEFATQAGLGHNSVYEMLRGNDPRLSTIMAVEQGTEGGVTLRQIAEHFLKEKEHGASYARIRRGRA